MSTDDVIRGGIVISRPKPVLFEWGRPVGFTLMSDLHIGAVSVDYALIKYEIAIAKEKKDRVAINGDVFDFILMGDHKRYQQDVLHPRLLGRKDVVQEAIRWGVELLSPIVNLIDMIGCGNHECHDDQTEILTESGWKLFADLSKNEKVATFNCDSERVEYQHTSHIHSSNYDGKLSYIQTPRHMDCAVTPNHRMVYKHLWSYKGVFNESVWNLKPLHDVPLKAAIKTVTASPSGNREYNVPEDYLRILGWVLTDGNISNKESFGKRVITIYQRESKVHLVMEILERMGVKFSTYIRNRKILSICGVSLKKPCEPSYEIRILQGNLRDWILQHLDSKKKIPDFIKHLSDRQFEILLSAIVDGDGSRHKSSPETSWMVYGRKPFLDTLQAMCVTHGWRATLVMYKNQKGPQWKLNINRHWQLSTSSLGRFIEERKYKGKVWCATVPNSTLITRRNGRVLISGNTALEKYHSFDPIQALLWELEKVKGRDKSHHINYGGYMGFMDYRFRHKGQVDKGKAPGESKGSRLSIYHHHGGGSNAPVTKGMIDFNRRDTYVDADIIWLGHKHNRFTSHVRKLSCPLMGDQPNTKEVRHIMTGAYVDTYVGQSQRSIKKDGRRSSWAADMGFSPQGKGGARVEVTPNRTADTRCTVLDLKVIQ